MDQILLGRAHLAPGMNWDASGSPRKKVNRPPPPVRVPKANHLFGQRFDLDESRPAYAPDDVVEAIVKAIDAARTAQEEGGG